ncbi:hypothetical protein [Haladaptatus sp. NG-SE-30]
MKSHERYVYEVTYDILDQYREEYETWLPKITEQWITTENLDGFRSERSVTDTSPDVRLSFEFEMLADWATFVESDPYQQSLDRLNEMTERFRTNLWEPTTISLSPAPSNGTAVALCDLRREG